MIPIRSNRLPMIVNLPHSITEAETEMVLELPPTYVQGREKEVGVRGSPSYQTNMDIYDIWSLQSGVSMELSYALSASSANN